MAESQKGTSSTNDSTKKSPLLDDEIGGDFLNCCKITTVSEDSLDFSSEMVPHGKKKTFDFNKMDMDFELDGGFDKISSFKLDMSDIDFSSPPRKAEKPNERSGKESVPGKPDGKQERFKFSFDFNELDGFDLDSSLLKGEKKSAKHPVNTTLDSPIKQAKGEDSINNLAMSIDTFERSGTKKIPTLVSGTKLKIGCLLSSHVDTNTQKDAAPTTLNKENRNVSPDVATSLEKEITAVSQEESRKYNKVPQHRENSEMTGSTESHAEHALQEASAQPISGDDSVVGTVPKKLQTGVCCLDAEVDKTPCIESDNNAKSIASSQSRNSSPINSHSLKHPPATCTRESQESDSELQKYSVDCNHVCSGSLKRNKPAHDNTGVQNGVAKSISQKLHSMKNTGENSNLNPNVLSSPFIRETRPNKPAPTRGKETSTIYSKCFSRSREPIFQSHSPSAPKKAMHLGFNGEKRGNDAQDRNQKVSTLTSSNRPVAKGLSVILRSEKNDNGQDTPCFQAPSVNLPVHMTPSSTLKNINPRLKLSSIAPITSPKITSLGRFRLTLNSDKKPCDIAGLKLSRNMMSKSEPSNSVQEETNAVKHSEEGIGTHGNMARKVVHTMDMEKHAPFSPSLKRKSFEGSNVDPVTFNPLKRATESPTESRQGWEDSQRTEEKAAQNLNDQDRDVVYDQLNSVPNLPSEASMTDLEVPLLIESDENIEKAETCAKELEDICNMLKKKHDEAKELLVRALVNNNLLLMLNHPIYEEKYSEMCHQYTISGASTLRNSSWRLFRKITVQVFTCHSHDNKRSLPCLYPHGCK